MSDTEVRTVSVDLTPEEVRERSLELSQKVGEARRLKADKTASAANFKQRDTELAKRIDALSDAVQSCKEKRGLECTWHRNDVALRMELVRPDTKEVIESRPMTQGERQPNLIPMDGGLKKVASGPIGKRKSRQSAETIDPDIGEVFAEE